MHSISTDDIRWLKVALPIEWSVVNRFLSLEKKRHSDWGSFKNILLCFVHPIFRCWFLVTFDDEVTKKRKYYVIFVYILLGKMGKTGKNGKKIMQLN